MGQKHNTHSGNSGRSTQVCRQLYRKGSGGAVGQAHIPEQDGTPQIAHAEEHLALFRRSIKSRTSSTAPTKHCSQKALLPESTAPRKHVLGDVTCFMETPSTPTPSNINPFPASPQNKCACARWMAHVRKQLSNIVVLVHGVPGRTSSGPSWVYIRAICDTSPRTLHFPRIAHRCRHLNLPRQLD